MAQYTCEEVIAAYEKLLREVRYLRPRRRPPDDQLPLPKTEMVGLLQRSTHPKKEQLIGFLSMFESSGANRDLFFSHLIMGPAFLALAYSVAIAVQGASWRWVSLALLAGVGGFFSMFLPFWVEIYAELPKWKRWGLLLLIKLGETVAVISWGAATGASPRLPCPDLPFSLPEPVCLTPDFVRQPLVSPRPPRLAHRHGAIVPFRVFPEAGVAL